MRPSPNRSTSARVDPVAARSTQSVWSRYSVARVTLGAGLLLYLAWSGAIDWSRLLGLAKAWHLTVAALLLLVLVVVLGSWRLCLLLSARGLELSLGASLRLSLIGAVFNNFLPGSSGGDLVRIYLAGRMSAGRRTEIATIIVLDRIIGLLALLLTPLLIAAAAPDFLAQSAALRALLAAAAVGSVLLAGVLALSAHPGSLLRRMVMAAAIRLRIRTFTDQIFDAVQSYRSHSRTILSTVALSLVMQALVIGAILLILIATTSSGASVSAALLTPFGMAANSLPLTPGGLGVGEAAFESLFRIGGITGGAEAILSWRILTTLIDAAGGAFLIAGNTDVRVLVKAARSPSRVDEPRERTGVAPS